MASRSRVSTVFFLSATSRKRSYTFSNCSASRVYPSTARRCLNPARPARKPLTPCRRASLAGASPPAGRRVPRSARPSSTRSAPSCVPPAGSAAACPPTAPSTSTANSPSSVSITRITCCLYIQC